MISDKLLRKKSRWVLKRTRKHLSPPDEVFVSVKTLFDTYGNARSHNSEEPLFKRRCKKVAENVLGSIRRGRVLDPVGVT